MGAIGVKRHEFESSEAWQRVLAYVGEQKINLLYRLRTERGDEVAQAQGEYNALEALVMDIPKQFVDDDDIERALPRRDTRA